jgi:hypothetical protein
MEVDFPPEERQTRLPDDERKILLRLSREALNEGVRGNALEPLNLDDLPDLARLYWFFRGKATISRRCQGAYCRCSDGGLPVSTCQ